MKKELKSGWEELNLKNLLRDAKKMDMKSLAQRYRVSTSYIYYKLKKHKVKPKNPYGHMSIETSKKRINQTNTSDMIDSTGVTAKPNKKNKYLSTQFPFNT